MTFSPSRPKSSKLPEEMRVSTRIHQHAARSSDTDVQDFDPDPDGDDTDYEIQALPADSVASPPMRRFANAIVRAADEQGCTPIVVPGACVSLTVDFFVALTGEMKQLCQRDIRIEALSPSAGGWAGVGMIPFHRRCVSALAASVPHGVDVVEMNRISRPAGPSRPLFMGLATDFRLARWLPRSSFYHLFVLESGTPQSIRFETQAEVQRYRLSAIEGGV